MLKSFVAIGLASTILVGCGNAQTQVGSRIEIPTNDVPLQHTKPNSLKPVLRVKPTSVRIIRRKHGKLGALDITIRNEPKVRQLYTDLRSLPRFPTGRTYCPLDTGVKYTLTFKHGNKAVLVAVADPTGCKSIKLSNGQTVWGIGQLGKPFWTLIADSIGLPNDSYLGKKP